MRKCPLKRRVPLAKQSRKRKAESVIYNRLRKDFLEDHPRCQWPLCVNRSTTVHHVTRRGRNYLNTESWRAMCMRCHQFIEENGRLARKLNWIVT